MTFKFSGVEFNVVSLQEVLDLISEQVHRGTAPKVISTINTDLLLIAQSDATFRNIVENSWIRTCDGTPILWISRFLRRPLPERVAGADLTELICQRGMAKHLVPFFLGAQNGVAEQAKEVVEQRFPGLCVAGTYSPSRGEIYSDVDSLRIAKIINDSGANILLVAFGSPIQEKWIARYKDNLAVSVIIGVGASLDFLSGRIKRAPKLLQHLGLEWFYRVLQEPRRLTPRYIRDFRLIKLLVVHLFRQIVFRSEE